jgi:hypothetical protein
MALDFAELQPLWQHQHEVQKSKVPVSLPCTGKL